MIGQFTSGSLSLVLRNRVFVPQGRLCSRVFVPETSIRVNLRVPPSEEETSLVDDYRFRISGPSRNHSPGVRDLSSIHGSLVL